MFTLLLLNDFLKEKKKPECKCPALDFPLQSSLLPVVMPLGKDVLEQSCGEQKAVTHSKGKLVFRGSKMITWLCKKEPWHMTAEVPF